MLRPSSLRAALVAVLCLAAVVPAAGPATAARWSAPDPAGDAAATTYSPEPEPCGSSVEEPAVGPDLRRVTVRHGRHRIHLSLAATGLDGLRRFSGYFVVRTRKGSWSVDVGRYGGPAEVSVTRLPGRDGGDECGLTFAFARPCRGAVGGIDRAAGVVSASLPRRCLGDPRAIRVRAATSGSQRRYDATILDDLWSADAGGSAYGPRLAAGPARATPGASR